MLLSKYYKCEDKSLRIEFLLLIVLCRSSDIIGIVVLDWNFIIKVVAGFHQLRIGCRIVGNWNYANGLVETSWRTLFIILGGGRTHLGIVDNYA